MFVRLFVVSTLCAVYANAATITSNSIDADCILQLPRLTFFAPLVFTTNGVLKSSETNGETDESFVRLSAGETVVLSCTPNHFKFNPIQSFEATCKTGQTLLVNGQEMIFHKTLGCDMRVIEEILAPVRGCDPNAALTSAEYGFTNPLNNQSYVLGEVCYDERLGRTLFVHTTFKSDYKNYDIEKVALRKENGDYFKQEHPQSKFKVDFMTAAFGFNAVTDMVQHRYIGNELLLNYQMYNIKKLGWNYVVVNGEQVQEKMLKSVEDAKTKLAFEGVADVFVGSHGVLRVLDKQGENKEVFLMNGRFPVAKFFWMVVATKNSNRAVAYVIPNGQGQSADELCTNQCEGTPGVHCCDYKDLQAQVSEMPSLEGTFTLLQK